MVLNIAQGMRYLHNRTPPVMHRDLKLENCLVTEHQVVKLSDFGESKEKVEGDEAQMTLVGTPYFIAPEVVNGDNYSTPCDVFSFAVVLACIGVSDGSAKKVFSEEVRKGHTHTPPQTHTATHTHRNAHTPPHTHAPPRTHTHRHTQDLEGGVKLAESKRGEKTSERRHRSEENGVAGEE